MRLRPLLRTSLATVACASAISAAVAQVMIMPTQAPIQVGIQSIEVDIASTPQQLAHGLMGRRSLPEGHGMLFVFPSTQRLCMWMKDTLLPLSVAFVDSRGMIINIAAMQPQSLAPHCSALPARYALEMRQGWFAAHQVGRGAQLRGFPFGTPLQH